MVQRLYIWIGLAAFAFSSHLGASEESEHGDFLHTCLARKVLSEDAQLSSANVGVRVKGRVAVLWGPVPSLTLAQRAASLLKARAEFVEVRNELVVLPDDDPWFIPALTRADPLDHAMPRSSGVLAGRIENERAPTLKHTEPTRPLPQRVRELRESRAEYQTFGVTFDGATIFVTTPPQGGDGVQDFLQALSRLAGVERVILRAN